VGRLPESRGAPESFDSFLPHLTGLVCSPGDAPAASGGWPRRSPAPRGGQEVSGSAPPSVDWRAEGERQVSPVPGEHWCGFALSLDPGSWQEFFADFWGGPDLVCRELTGSAEKRPPPESVGFQAWFRYGAALHWYLLRSYHHGSALQGPRVSRSRRGRGPLTNYVGLKMEPVSRATPHAPDRRKPSPPDATGSPGPPSGSGSAAASWGRGAPGRRASVLACPPTARASEDACPATPPAFLTEPETHSNAPSPLFRFVARAPQIGSLTAPLW
jgi:hypothetical protein